MNTENIKYIKFYYNPIVRSSLKFNSNTGCGNITSFFIMRGNRAVEVEAGLTCFHSRDVILVSLEVVRNVRLPSKPTFRIDCL